MANRVLWAAIVVGILFQVFFSASYESPPSQNAEELEAEQRLAQPAPRTIYFKLPIAQTTYHWVFQERAAFLAGTLTLDIVRDDQRERITVFENGNITEGWEEISCTSAESPTEIYFGFVSDQRFAIANTDRVEMVLTVPEDIEGVGPHCEGILRAGEYRASDRVTIYSTHEDTAFLRKEDWKPQWDVAVTAETGWMNDR